ncbi:hypothetical protein CMO88_01190 [Candidatus Woesearchaeota archaeon]|nr:hypothetical protein [Candidatus Woesearchaeota archaeon]|tara:strand:+ start:687 stop:1760 length:1074 start_codon:yes stop_codon:yes gene_type:complete
MKGLIKNILLISLTFLVLLAILEFAVRAGPHSACYIYSEGMFEQDEQLCYKLVPNFEGELASPAEYRITVNTNSMGFRNEEIGEKEKDRILIAGDSFALGVGVEQEETFSALLGKQLVDYEVINVGVPSYETWREKVYLQNNKLEPDIVILAFFHNDINGNENENICMSNVRKGYLVNDNYANMPLPLFNLRIFLNTKAESYCMLKDNALNIKSRLTKRELEPAIQGSLLTYFTKEPYKGKTAENWNTTKRLLKETAEVVKESGSEFIILIIPDKFQVEEDSWKPLTERYGITSKDFDMEKLNRLIKEFGEESSITVIDPLPQLREAEEKVYYDFDRHFNEKGNKIVSEVIYEQLKS